MTEEQWLTSDSVSNLIEFLRDREHLTADDRKLRLFACGCCADFRDLLDEQWRELLDLCERFAGSADLAQRLDAAKERILDYYRARTARWGFIYRAVAAACGPLQLHSSGTLQISVNPVLSECADAYRHHRRLGGQSDSAGKQLDLLRCVFGNPFRRVSFDPAWRSIDVQNLALAIDEERRFSDLPVLADALEDAGCPEANMLDHCRHDQHHTRGCWVVDTILERG